VSSASAAPHASVRPDWLALRTEPILEPDLVIVDPHHHLWERVGSRYLPQDFLDDVNSGHKVAATVFVQSRSMLRASGPAELATLGEVEFAVGAAAMGASGFYGPARICEGIVAGADLSLGARVEAVLEAMLRCAGSRLSGVRNPVVWHADSAVKSSTATVRPGVMGDPQFRAGAALLAKFNLALDVWAYHTQLDELFGLASALPDVTVVIDHFGGPIGSGPYAGKREEMFVQWSRAMQRLASLPNTRVKLGGGGMPVFGFGFHELGNPPSSIELANAMKPYVDGCIEWFGVQRCMFESNFPVDKGMFSYHVLWNAFKRLTHGASDNDKMALFSGTAIQTYRLANTSSHQATSS
jgi:L-fuconolactonase